MMRIWTIRNLGPKDTKFQDDYWFYLGALNQVVTWWQETKKEVATLNDKVIAFIDQEDFPVKFLDNAIREVDLVTVEVRYLLQRLIMTEDVNSYQSGSHLEYMMRAHTLKSRMLDFAEEVSVSVAGNQLRFREMLRGLEHTASFIDDVFEERVANLDPPDA